MRAVGRVGSHWHCLTLVVVSGLAQQRQADEECLQNPSAVLSTGCCIQRLEHFVVFSSCAASCSGLPGLQIPSSPLVSVIGFVFMEQQ